MAKTRSHVPGRAAVLGAGVLTLAVLAVCLWAFSARFPRLEVGGYRITREEYLRAMYQARNEILSDHAAAGISLTDWSSETALGDPCKLTAGRALEILSEYYAVSLLAVERGYLQDAGYDALLRELEELNEQRQQAMEDGAVITGIPQFQLTDYITYRASGFRREFCADPDNPEYQVTREDIRLRYEADRDNLYVRPDDLELAFLVVNTEAENADALAAELERLRALALEAGGLAPALEEMPELKPFFEEITVDQGSYSVYARSHGDILAFAEGLQSGELSPVLREEGWLCLVECRQRVEHRYAPLEDVESVVIQSIRESRYDALIAQRMADMEIKADLPALYRFTAEQLS